MHNSRKLTLKRERLAELSGDQLDGLAGGLAEAKIEVMTTATCPSDAKDCGTIDVKCNITYRGACPTTAVG